MSVYPESMENPKTTFEISEGHSSSGRAVDSESAVPGSIPGAPTLKASTKPGFPGGKAGER